MKIEWINPFIDATVTTCETMCGVKPVRNGALRLHEELLTPDDLMGVLGLSGTVKGSVVLSMPVQVGILLVGKFVGETITQNGSDLTDGFGELLNIIAGAAVANIHGHKITLSLPTVMIGHGNVIRNSKVGQCISIPMAFPGMGEFSMYVSMADG